MHLARFVVPWACVSLGSVVFSATELVAQTPLDEPRVVAIGKGLYVIHNPRANESWPQSNTMVVIGADAVLVVDAAYLPATARADIAIIRKLTDKPVRYLVNTHWHYDHTNGNGEYRREFPSLQIVGHPETWRLLRENVPRYVASVLAPDSPVRQSVQNSIKALADLGTKSDAAERAVYERRLAQRQLELAEIAKVAPTLPTVLVSDEVRFDLGARSVVVRFLGRANTPGDLTVYVPDGSVLATGDLVVSPMPYAYGSNPSSWIRVLETVLGAHADVIVPGHGDVMRDMRYVERVRTLLVTVTEGVQTAYRAGKTVEAARASIDFEPFREQFAGKDPFLLQVFESSIVVALVDRAWAEAQGTA